jgi:hypothetical protein
MAMTAVAFSETAAVIDPENPILSIEAGKATRNAAMPDRSEIWFERGIQLAARKKSRRELIRGLLGYGALLTDLDRLPEAQKKIDRASRLAAQTRRHRQAAEAAHDLLGLAILAAAYDDAERFALEAIQSYPIHHPSVPTLVHDWAFHLVRMKLYAEALPLLVQSVSAAKRPDLRMLFAGTMARAAGGTGRREHYDRAEKIILTLAESYQRWSAAALANLAEGARFFREWDNGERYAARAVAIAAARGEADVQRGALEILDGIAARVPPAPQQQPPKGSRVLAINRRLLELMGRRKKKPRRPVQTDRDQPDPEPGPEITDQ